MKHPTKILFHDMVESACLLKGVGWAGTQVWQSKIDYKIENYKYRFNRPIFLHNTRNYVTWLNFIWSEGESIPQIVTPHKIFQVFNNIHICSFSGPSKSLRCDATPVSTAKKLQLSKYMITLECYQSPNPFIFLKIT